MRVYILGVLVCAVVCACSDDAADGGGDAAADATGDRGDLADDGVIDAGDAGDTADDSGSDVVLDSGDDPDGGGGDVVADADDGGADATLDSEPDGDHTERQIEHVGTPCLELELADLMLGTTFDVLNGAVWVNLNADEREAAYALSLVGTDRISVGSAFLIAACTEETEFIPFCEAMEDLQGGVRCSQIGCEAAGIQLVHVWFNQGVGTDTTRDERGTFSYPLETSAGTVTYDPNPLLTWRSDLSDDPNVMSAELDNAVTVSFDGGATVDFSHTGTAQVIRPVEDHGTVTTSLTFTGLDDSETGLLVQLTLDTEDTLGGLVLSGDDELATIAAPTPERITVTWAACP